MLGGFRAVMVAGTHEADDNFACRRKGKKKSKRANAFSRIWRW